MAGQPFGHSFKTYTLECITKYCVRVDNFLNPCVQVECKLFLKIAKVKLSLPSGPMTRQYCAAGAGLRQGAGTSQHHSALDIYVCGTAMD